MENSKNNIDVSIVIVCMNNLKNLYPCLESIRKYTNTSYECLVVAYLFTKNNIKQVKENFPWVTFIESNEIRGFSENNNLALRQAKGKYCFVLNDDTEMKMPVIDKLLATIKKLPNDVAVVSPRSVFGDGSFQSNGRTVHTTWKYILTLLHLYDEKKELWKIRDKRGLFETGDIVGAFFLIKTDLFRKVGFFDERFFFCPEDIALGYELRKLGYRHFVNADIEIIHYEGMSGGQSVSWIKIATAPAGTRGSLIFFSHNNKLLYALLSLIKVCSLFPKFVYLTIKSMFLADDIKTKIVLQSCKNSMIACITTMTPKQLFTHYYDQINTSMH